MRLLPDLWATQWTTIPRSLLKAKQLEKLKASLTFSNPSFYEAEKRGYSTEGMTRQLVGYVEEGDSVFVPRNYNLHRIGLPTPQRYSHKHGAVTVDTTIKLRDNQQEAFSALLDHIKNREDGILSLSCGKGKTVLAIAAWAAYPTAGPAIAICPTLDIVYQWRDRLVQFTNLKQEDVGIIGDGHEDIDKPFVVATLQTLAKKPFPMHFYSRFGVIYFDECHRLGAPYFSRVAPLFTGTRIGLSATWQRSDRMELLFTGHIGPVFFEDHTQDLIPSIHFKTSPVQMRLEGFRRWGAAELNFAKIITNLSRNTTRQAFILGLIDELYVQDRKILVLGDRIDELETFLTATQVTYGAGNASICVGNRNGRSVPSDERRRALSARVVLATAQLVKEGLDEKAFDSLVILYPKSNAAFAEQASGRILRQAEGKKAPIVYVVHDAGAMFQSRSPFTSMCKSMAYTFKRLGYKIEGTSA